LPSDRTIEFIGDAENGSDESARVASAHHYQVGRAQTGINAVMEYLYAIAEMRPLSIWWVILLLTALAFLLGPVDYNVLKRLGRLPLTWLTCAMWIILFTVGAYYGVQALRGGKMQFRVVSVLDGIDDGCAWSTAYCGMFAPRSDDYRLEGLQENQWWSGIAPTGDNIYARHREAGSRNIYCSQQDGYNRVDSLPVNIWTIQCLLSESPLPQLPLEAEVHRNGNEIIVSIINRSDSPINRGYVLFGNDRVFDFDQVPALASKEFQGSLSHRRSWNSRDAERYRSVRFNCEKAFFARGCLQRTQAMRAYLASGAAAVCAEYENVPLSFAVKNRSCDYSQVQLVRLVVFPEEGALTGQQTGRGDFWVRRKGPPEENTSEREGE
jgi:hypothetical protein